MPRRKFRLTRKWKVNGTVIIVAILFYALFHFVISPRIESLFAEYLPEIHAVHTNLEEQYPDKEAIFVGEDTNYREYPVVKILYVEIIGYKLLSNDEIKKAKRHICGALGPNAGNYKEIVLQNTEVKRFLPFYFKKSQGESFACD